MDNNNSQLAGRDYVIAIDKSGSMNTKLPNGRTRWQYAEEQCTNIARKCEEWDDDGIDVLVFSGSKVTEYKNVTADKVAEIFKNNEPNGATPTHLVIDHVANNYFASKAKSASEAKPVTLVVYTDGEPSDEKAVIDSITRTANKLDRDEEFAITFLQVGDDTNARAFLERLDNDLVSKYGAKFDIVDTRNEAEMETMTVNDVLMAAIND